jgi:hypothetical protein
VREFKKYRPSEPGLTALELKHQPKQDQPVTTNSSKRVRSEIKHLKDGTITLPVIAPNRVHQRTMNLNLLKRCVSERRFHSTT